MLPNHSTDLLHFDSHKQSYQVQEKKAELLLQLMRGLQGSWWGLDSESSEGVIHGK
jgi:hypothetical protein